MVRVFTVAQRRELELELDDLDERSPGDRRASSVAKRRIIHESMRRGINGVVKYPTERTTTLMASFRHGRARLRSFKSQDFVDTGEGNLGVREGSVGSYTSNRYPTP